MVGLQADLTHLSDCECDPEAAYYARRRSSLAMGSRFWSNCRGFKVCDDGLRRILYVGMFQGPVASQPLIRFTLMGLVNASGLG